MLSYPMKQALAEARKYLGATAPNPAVGAVAVDASGNVLAVAAHKRAGEDHAEAALLKICREKNLLARAHTLYVTLEPCNHQGRTPPCSEALIQSGIKHIIIGTHDPNLSVKGGSFERLRKAGIDVTVTDDNECQQLIAAFAYHARTHRPFLTIKRALNREGSMIPPPGQKIFTSHASQILAHRLRKKADAIITGSGTILADNPLFTVRHMPDHLEKRRWLAILDRRDRVPKSYITSAKARGLDVLLYSDIEQALEDLARRGAKDVLAEAGPALSASLLAYPYWAMSVTIHQADVDKIDVAFNPHEKMPFDTGAFIWDSFLPQDKI